MKTSTALLALAALLTLGGCATGDRFALLPDDSGKVGQITVSTRAGQQDLNEAGTLTRVKTADSAPTPPKPIAQNEIDRLWGVANAIAPRAATSVLLYFETGGSVLTADSVALLPSLPALIAQYPAPDVSVIGHTDTVGAADVNERIALERAEAVRNQLVAAGIDPAIITVTSHGEANPLVPTGDNVDQPRNRRVEVAVR